MGKSAKVLLTSGFWSYYTLTFSLAQSKIDWDSSREFLLSKQKQVRNLWLHKDDAFCKNIYYSQKKKQSKLVSKKIALHKKPFCQKSC